MAPLVEQLWQRVARLKDPFSGRTLRELGCVRDIQLARSIVTVQLAPLSADRFRNEALRDAISRELAGVAGVSAVSVQELRLEGGVLEALEAAGRTHSLPVLNGPADTGSDAVRAVAQRADLAPEAGYGLDGPPLPPAPELDPALGERYEGWPPVFQWEIDPGDVGRAGGEVHVELGDWEYDVWWQAHPAELLYVSIQALRDDDSAAGPQRPHPVGRNVVVNMVYDVRRNGVVAIYGTARDFRPFVEALRIGLGLQRPTDRSKT